MPVPSALDLSCLSHIISFLGKPKASLPMLSLVLGFNLLVQTLRMELAFLQLVAEPCELADEVLKSRHFPMHCACAFPCSNCARSGVTPYTSPMNSSIIKTPEPYTPHIIEPRIHNPISKSRNHNPFQTTENLIRGPKILSLQALQILNPKP